MTKLTGNCEEHTLLILTDAESRLLRKVISQVPEAHEGFAALAALNAGIMRGTAKLNESFKTEQARKKAAKK